MAGAAGVFTGGGATVVMDPPAVVYVKVFHTGSSPDRRARANAQRVAVLARQLAPVGKTGILADSIFASQNRNEKGGFAFGYSVGTPVYYGLFVHEGTGPSPRWPNPQHKVMKFRGSRPEIGYRDFVMHPGISAQPFLQEALVAMVGG